jgi:predicted HicB family RNase H-like nuclease
MLILMARPKVHHEERVTTALRVPRGLHDRLKSAAEERQVGVNLLAVKALEDYLDRLVPLDHLQLTRP